MRSAVSLGLALCLALLPGASPALAANWRMSYQGNVRKSGIPLTGSHTVAFKIYPSSTTGAAIWSAPGQSVNFNRGVFAVTIDPSAIDWEGVNPHLEISIDGVTLSPREELNAAPLAFNAQRHSGKLYASSPTTPSSASGGDLWYDTNANVLRYYNGGGWVSPTAGMTAVTSNANQFSGDGNAGTPLTLRSSSVTLQGNDFNAANLLVKLDGSGRYPALDGSLISNISDSSKVLKGGDSMTGQLTLRGGSISVSSFSTLGAVGIGGIGLSDGTLVVRSTSTDATNPVVNVQANNGTELFRLQQNGLLGLGTSSPGTLLDVAGAAQFGSAGSKSAFTAAGALTMASNANITLSGTGEVRGVPAVPSANDAAASKKYVDDTLSGSAGGWSDDGTVVRLTASGDSVVVQSTLTVSNSDASGYSLKLSSGISMSAGTVVADGFVGKGTGISTLDAGKVVTGLLANTYGGTGQDSSGWTGFAKVAGGAWSAAAIASGDLPAGGYDSTYVNAAGDSMTGPLTLWGSTITIAGPAGNAFSVGASTFNIKDGMIGIGATSPQEKLYVSSGSVAIDFGLRLSTLTFASGLIADPATASNGMMYYNASTGKLRYYSSGWNELGVSGAGYATVQDEGGALTQRAILNFTGAGIAAADNLGNTRTDITLDADLEDLADGTLSGSKVGSGVAAGNIAAGAFGSGVRILPEGVDLSTVTSALANKTNTTDNIATSRIDLSTVTAAIGSYVSRTGDAMTGQLTIRGASVGVSSITALGSVGIGGIGLGNGTLVVKSTSTDATNPVVNVQANNAAELLRVQQDGKVGIGTSEPSVGLHLKGNMHIDTSGTSYLTRNITVKSGGSAIDWASYGGGWAPGLMLQGTTAGGAAESATEFLFFSALDDTQPALIASGKDLEIYTGAPIGASGSRSLYLGALGNVLVGPDA
ncbi:MAG: hypothetical protein WC943_14475, partial [Elusimicrobiota bacterium]